MARSRDLDIASKLGFALQRASWLSALLLGALLSPISARAAEMEERGPVTLPGTVQYVLQSAEISGAFRIDVALPPDYAGTKRRYPVVYLTDSNSTFALARGATLPLQAVGLLPQFILVGIGWEDENPLAFLTLRNRDLTPTRDEEWEEERRKRPAPWSMPVGLETGKAGNFFRLIESSVKPFLDAHYRTDPQDETLVGHSLGGLFALYVLFHHGDSFERYIIGSPSIQWDDAVTVGYEESYSQTHSDLVKRVFFSVGSLEPEEMVGNTLRMVERLESRRYPGLELDSQVFEDEEHISVIGPTFTRGLRFVLGGRLPPSR